MCQMEWHTVRVTKKGLNVTISLDNYDAVSGPVTSTRAAGDLFLGGFPGKIPTTYSSLNLLPKYVG